jgi:methylglyoxal synthase
MRNFVLFFERTLQQFNRVITTGTTGAQILELVPSLNSQLLRYESGPHGGDIRIAFEILAGTCHDVVFFLDPLHAHAHLADIRVLTLACNQVGANLVTNHTAARDWITMLTQYDRSGAFPSRVVSNPIDPQFRRSA